MDRNLNAGVSRKLLATSKAMTTSVWNGTRETMSSGQKMLCKRQMYHDEGEGGHPPTPPGLEVNRQRGKVVTKQLQSQTHHQECQEARCVWGHRSRQAMRDRLQQAISHHPQTYRAACLHNARRRVWAETEARGGESMKTLPTDCCAKPLPSLRACVCAHMH